MVKHKELFKGIYLVKIPMPLDLDHVNCYAFRGKEGWYIVDAGLNCQETRKAWGAFMAEQGIEPVQIKAIYITHSHIDHFGAAGWLQMLSGAPVYMSNPDYKSFKRVCNIVRHSPEFKRKEAIMSFLANNGVPQGLISNIVEHIVTSAPYFDVEINNIKILGDGEEFILGEYKFSAILTPGHSEGHLCFYNRENGIFLSGDHLLSKITPHIGVHWNDDKNINPLKNFLDSLKKIKSLPIKYVLPAHGPTFTEARERIDYIEKHHNSRLSQVCALAKNSDSIYEISKELFGPGLPASEIGLAIAEILAHINYLGKQHVSSLK